MPNRLLDRLNAALERRVPEKRLFLKSGDSTRFVRLRPVTQIATAGGMAAVFAWSIAAGALVVNDRLGLGGDPVQITRAGESIYEDRLAALSQERDSRAAEAAGAQQRYAVALDQVAQMQSRLLESEQRVRELEAGLTVAQTNLQKVATQRDVALAKSGEDVVTDVALDLQKTAELEATVDLLSSELTKTADARTKAETEARTAREAAQQIALARDELVARNDEIFERLEEAVTVSVKPYDDMFRKIGIDADELLATVEEGYSGTGGPLTPMGYSTRGNADITANEAKATEIMISLDQVNRYRIAAHKLPLAMPVVDNHRLTSGFGPRWGRMHQGVDFAAPVGTPIVAPGEGTVTFAGWQRGYGYLIKVQHELGVETRYGHLSKMSVKVGQKVSRGQRIGDMGNTGRSTGPHLHYEVRVNGQAINPMSFIKAAQNVF